MTTKTVESTATASRDAVPGAAPMEIAAGTTGGASGTAIAARVASPPALAELPESALQLAEQPRLKTVSICDTQPVTAEGVRTLLEENPELRFLEAMTSLRGALEHVKQAAPDVLLVDKAFGIQAIMDWLSDLRAVETAAAPLRTQIVIWGISVTEAEALRFLQTGARGILRKTASVNVVLACLRTVSNGRSWMEDCVFRDASRAERYPRSELTSREQQVLELVEQGFKNKEIAQELGIRPGTVKIHLKHIFEKTGVRGRYGLALSGLKDRGLVSMPV
jgi:DNA-binding NarL/FixJ family response regulator